VLDMVRVKSTTGEERDLCDRMEKWARAVYGADVSRVGNALLGGRVAQAGGQKPLVVLAGHLDTVPLHPEDGTPRVEGGRIHGRGASDMKSGLAVMTALAERRGAWAYDLAVIFYDREEGPYAENGMQPLLDAHPGLKGAALAVLLEPTDNDLHLGCIGSLHAKVTFKGRASHSARPWQGENAIHKAGELLVKLGERGPQDVEVAGLRFREVMSVTTAQGGAARNVVPDAFTLNLNYRFAPGRTLESAQDEVRRFVADCSPVGLGPLVEFVDLAPSGAIPVGNPTLDELRAAVEGAGGKVQAKQGWTDVARLSAMGIPAVCFGPGETAQAHKQGESTGAAALDAGYAVLARFLSGARPGTA
jgi:succinyl-diaminopimelate desuccinylase